VASGFHNQAPAPADTSVVRANNPAVAAHFPVVVEEWEATGLPDLHGNEVVYDAVATYELDEAGSLYEVHSPETELPRLASPVG
jgi:hypothetical protein